MGTFIIWLVGIAVIANVLAFLFGPLIEETRRAMRAKRVRRNMAATSLRAGPKT